MNSICNQKGASIIAVIAVMLILAVMGATLISLVTTGSDVSVNQLQSEQALNVVEGGKEYILANRTFPNYSTQGAITNLGAGNFRVATPAYVTPNPIAVGDTTINVDSTAKFPSSGRIIIDSELIDYTGTTPTSFTGATRGTGSIATIAFDAASSSNLGDNVTNLTWAHTVTALGSNRILVVGVSIRGTNAVSTVTYAGTPLTLVGAQNETTNDNARVEIWQIVAPATGANNIVVDFGVGNNTRFVVGAVSLTGVDQTTPIDAAFAGDFGNSLTPTVAITTVTNNAWVIDTLAARNAPVATVGADQTQRWNTSIATRITGAGSTEGPKTPAGTVTMSWTLSVARDWAIGAVAIRPAPTPTTLTHEEVY